MDSVEAKVRCLELAASVARPQNRYDAVSIVEIATALYTFIEAPPQPEKVADIADKPRRGRPPKVPSDADILS